MGNIIIFKDVNFSYNESENAKFENFSLEIEEGSFTTIVGPNGSGKSTLVKLMLGLLETDGFIKINNKFVNVKNIKTIRKQIGVVFDNPNNQFICDTVQEDLEFALANFGYKQSVIKKKIKAVVDLLKIEDLLDCTPEQLSGGQKQLVALAIAIAHDPKIIILDEALQMFDEELKTRIISILKKINEKKVTIINITHDCEDILVGTHVIIINNYKLVLNAPVKKAFENLKVFKDNKINLPFVIDLSSKLKYYDAVDKNYYDYKRLVDDLWK